GLDPAHEGAVALAGLGRGVHVRRLLDLVDHQPGAVLLEQAEDGDEVLPVLGAALEVALAGGGRLLLLAAEVGGVDVDAHVVAGRLDDLGRGDAVAVDDRGDGADARGVVAGADAVVLVLAGAAAVGVGRGRLRPADLLFELGDGGVALAAGRPPA